MKCYVCGEDAATETIELVNLDGVANVEAVVRRCSACGEETVGYDRMEELFRQVASELLGADRRLRPPELVWLRKYVGASGKDWAIFIDRNHSTLSRWENGKEEYPLAFERLLRLAAKEGPIEWEYPQALRDTPEGGPPIELRTNSAGHWVRM